MKSLIAKAIHDRRLVRLTYDGLPKTVEPHVLGLTLKRQEALLCWQVFPPMRQAGFWRLLPLADILDVQVTDALIKDRPEGPVPPTEDFSMVLAILQQ